jgi:hypothetical protein
VGSVLVANIAGTSGTASKDGGISEIQGAYASVTLSFDVYLRVYLLNE